MNNTPEDPLEITKFCQFANNMISQIQQCPQHFRSVLLLALLDTLSKSAAPQIRKNGERFVKLIDDFSGWAYKDFVSLSQLYLLTPTDSKLKQFLGDSISKYQSGQILRPEQADVPLETVLSYCSENEKPNAQKVRYASLLWALRNSLSHSFMSPGNGWQLSRYNSTPYYFNHIGTKNWEFYIDAEVLAIVARQTISNLGDYFDRVQINPYESFSWSSSWLDR